MKELFKKDMPEIQDHFKTSYIFNVSSFTLRNVKETSAKSEGKNMIQLLIFSKMANAFF